MLVQVAHQVRFPGKGEVGMQYTGGVGLGLAVMGLCFVMGRETWFFLRKVSGLWPTLNEGLEVVMREDYCY